MFISRRMLQGSNKCNYLITRKLQGKDYDRHFFSKYTFLIGFHAESVHEILNSVLFSKSLTFFMHLLQALIAQ